MSISFHGLPCWFELSIADPDAAQGFYAPLFNWAFADSGMPDFDYRLAGPAGAMVAGVLPLDICPPGTPPNWMIYIAVDDCDATAAQVTALGGKVWKEPADIPGTGRFAVLGDPQGAVFGILQVLPMDTPPPSSAFDQKKAGHGNWIELMSTDPKAALDFYGALFGWAETRVFDMGDIGGYHLFDHMGDEIGGAMGLGPAPFSHWLPYFGVDDVAGTLAAATAAGAQILNGPNEVPGPALIATIKDPQGAIFAVVGPKP